MRPLSEDPAFKLLLRVVREEQRAIDRKLAKLHALFPLVGMIEKTEDFKPPTKERLKSP